MGQVNAKASSVLCQHHEFGYMTDKQQPSKGSLQSLHIIFLKYLLGDDKQNPLILNVAFLNELKN